MHKLSLLTLLAVVSLVAAACGPAPFPDGKLSYVGYWVSDDYSYAVSVSADGYVDHVARVDGVESTVSGAITEWRGDNFVTLFKEFVVTAPPAEVTVDDGAGGEQTLLEMTVDGFVVRSSP